MKDFRNFYLPAKSRQEIEHLPDKGRAIVILPTGAIEQHGPHLPVGVDSILGQVWLSLALPQVSNEIPVYVAPPVTIGKSDEHKGFPGTLFISTTTFGRLLRAVTKQLKSWGFNNLAIFNTHGGNISIIRYTLREIQVEFGLRAFLLRPSWRPPLSEQEETYGFHANEFETSCMLEMTEGLVDMSKAVCEYPAHIKDAGELRPEDAPATFAWATQDLSKTGIIGDASAASFEKGKDWVEKYASSLARQIERLYEGICRS